MMRKIILFFTILLFFTYSLSLAKLTLKANNDHIKINFFYHGDEVTISGTSDPGVDIIVKIVSPDTHQVFKKKGKVAGLFWMNVGTLNFEKVPNLYYIHSSKNITDILDAMEIEREVIGYNALLKHIEIKPIASEEEKERWFKEFVKFKEASKLYQVKNGDVIISLKNGTQEYFLKILWPYQAPPGEYTVTIYAIKDKKIVDKAETKILVEQVGIVKTLTQMAKENAILYGIISIVVALAAGFGVGMIFRKGGSH